MFVSRSLFASWIALAFVGTAAAAAERHPLSVEDLVRFKRVSDPALSPDGKTVVFAVRETDVAANRGRQDLWSLDLATKGAQPRRLTTDPENDNAPEWSRDGRYVYFISSRGGSAQVWRLPSAGGEAEPVTSLPLDVGSFRLAPDGARLAVSMDVFGDCEDLACSSSRIKQAADSKATGKIYDRTFVRHWDTWDDGRISQLFVLQIADGRAVEPRSLTAALDADVPSKPFGDASEYAFSPDGSKLVFGARIKGKSEPWSTNFDLYEVSIEGGEPRNLTADNPAWDTQPVFSPDGSMMAWRAMKRPGFEADRFHVMIADLKSGQRRELAQDWDRSADQIEFSADGRTLYAVADHFGQRPLWAIDVKTGKATMLTGPGTSIRLQSASAR
jgi:Dipeptidyl aminopeptidases/acylaminoacyl-peptidases